MSVYHDAGGDHGEGRRLSQQPSKSNPRWQDFPQRLTCYERRTRRPLDVAALHGLGLWQEHASDQIAFCHTPLSRTA